MTARILLIGASGFIGTHLARRLAEEHGADAVHAADRRGGALSLDVSNGDAIRAVLDAVHPTHVVNLAGIAAPGTAAQAEAAAWALHLDAVRGLGQAVLDRAPAAWLVHAGSGLAYGRTGRLGRPMTEADAMEPMDAYGASKAAGDLALGALAERGLRVARMRPFNATGPGQTADFAIPAFAAQVAAIEAGRQEPVLSVGNLEAERDFLHVSDVVEAYAAVIRRSGDLTPGHAFNVASGRAVAIRHVLDDLLSMTSRPIEVAPDPDRQRPSDLPTISGDATRLREATGWAPRVDLRDALAEVLEHERRRLRASAS